jgi:hypothetical protein
MQWQPKEARTRTVPACGFEPGSAIVVLRDEQEQRAFAAGEPVETVCCPAHVPIGERTRPTVLALTAAEVAAYQETWGQHIQCCVCGKYRGAL